MGWKRTSLFIKGYSFLARNMVAGIVVNKILDLLAWLDYRLLILLSMWHPDMRSRIKLLRRRGVKISKKAFVDMGVFIEITTPQSVVIEDYAAIGYGTIIYSHDAGANTMADLPLRIKAVRIGYNTAIGSGCIILPGVQIGDHCAVLAGSVVTSNVPDQTVVAGHPAKPFLDTDKIVAAWQADMKNNPDIYYDNPAANRPPTTPYDDLITWRKEGMTIRPWTDIRTGTPFDHILDYKAMRRSKVAS